MKRRRRGRPRKADAKRNTTTRQGRATGKDPVDRGAPGLVRRKYAVGGRLDLGLDGSTILYGHDLINRQQYDRLGEVTHWLQLVARAWGGANGSVAGLWNSILATLSRARTVGAVPIGADAARFRLVPALGRLIADPEAETS